MIEAGLVGNEDNRVDIESFHAYKKDWNRNGLLDRIIEKVTVNVINLDINRNDLVEVIINRIIEAGLVGILGFEVFI